MPSGELTPPLASDATWITPFEIAGTAEKALLALLMIHVPPSVLLRLVLVNVEFITPVPEPRIEVTLAVVAVPVPIVSVPSAYSLTGDVMFPSHVAVDPAATTRATRVLFGALPPSDFPVIVTPLPSESACPKPSFVPLPTRKTAVAPSRALELAIRTVGFNTWLEPLPIVTVPERLLLPERIVVP